MSAADIGRAIGSSIQNFATYSAKAAGNANGVSQAAQNAQGLFNSNQAALANQIGADRIAEQYAFNSAQAASANQFTSDMWDKAAAWNEAMLERQMEFNAAEAQKNRDWQQKMMETSYQRAVADMQKAGLNPILAVTGGGISTGSGSGSAASVGGTSMSGATGQAASGGLMNGISSSVGNYSGQMEYMGGMLGLLSAGINGIASALQAFGTMGDVGSSIGDEVSKILSSFTKDNFENPNTKFNKFKRNVENYWDIKMHSNR